MSRNSWSSWATADLQMVNRYVKLLPQPGENDAAARLNDYLRRSASDPRGARVRPSHPIAL
jgi:hypothetical protein